MSESLRRSVLVPAQELLPQAVEATEGLFRPTEAQVRAKSRFWAKWADSPLMQGKEPTLALAQQLTGSSTLANWWAKAGFKEWFLNRGSNTERVEWLTHLALNAAQDLLLSDDPKSAGARAQMIKLVLDLATKVPTQEPKKTVEALSKEDLLKIVSSATTTPQDSGEPQ